MTEDIEVKKLPRHDILNLKAVLEKLAESKPVQQELEEIRTILDPLAEDLTFFASGLACVAEHMQELEEDKRNMWLQIRTIQSRLDGFEEGKLHLNDVILDMFTRISNLEQQVNASNVTYALNYPQI